MTSNREREFAPAFVRRCIRIHLEEPDKHMLGDIVAKHFDEDMRVTSAGLIEQFLQKRSQEDLATDQLLNAIYLVFKSGKVFTEDEKAQLVEKLFKPISGRDAI